MSDRCPECGQGEGSPSEVDSLHEQLAEANRVIEKMQADRDRDVAARAETRDTLLRELAASVRTVTADYWREYSEANRLRAQVTALAKDRNDCMEAAMKAQAQVAALTEERDMWMAELRLANAEVTRLRAALDAVSEAAGDMRMGRVSMGMKTDSQKAALYSHMVDVLFTRIDAALATEGKAEP